MSPKDTSSNNNIGRIKTGKFERRFSLFKAGVTAGARLAGRSAQNLFSRSSQKADQHSAILREESQRFVHEIGQLKGSVVKIGQMMALWGEHYLPEEMTEALHQLEDQTSPVDWHIMKITLLEDFTEDQLNALEIDPHPIGAASLGQVHRATRKSDGKALCIKIQYPQIAQAIETDLDAVQTLVKICRLAPNTEEFDRWFEEIRNLLRREVDYTLEAETTQRFADYLKDDARYRVPEILPEYSSGRVLCMSYEAATPIADQAIKNLPQVRKNNIAKACLDLCWREVFEWGEMQTDPNFGNYLVKLDERTDISESEKKDQLVLLDFGAIRKFEDDILRAGKKIVNASLHRQGAPIAEALKTIGFFSSSTPPSVLQEFIDICFLAIEPFVDTRKHQLEIPDLVDEQQAYHWAQSKLPTRVLLKAKSAAFSRYFNIPPKDFMYFSRKLIGTFTLMAVLNAEINGHDLIKPYVKSLSNSA